MKKMLTLLLSVFLLVGLVSCDPVVDDTTNDDNTTQNDDNNPDDNGTDPVDNEPEITGDNTYTYQVVWAQLNDQYENNVTIVDVDGTEAMVAGGSMQLGQVTSSPSTDSYFGTGNALSYVHDGVDSWGGVFFNGVADTDLSAVTEFKIAVKGTLPTELGAWGYKVEGGNGTAQELNIMLYEEENGDDDWRLFVIPATEYDEVELDAFGGIGIWNPKQGDDLTFEGGYVGMDIIIDVAVK